MKSDTVNDQYRFLPDLMLRFPSYHNEGQITKELIYEFIKDDFFMEALWIASKDLYEAVLRIDTITDPKKLEKIEVALSKYINRTKNRSTPFGLFAGCAPVSWAENTQITLGATSKHTRLDMGLLCTIFRYVLKNESIKKSLKYSVNKTLYDIDGNYRMVDYKTTAYRKYTVSSVTGSEYLQEIIDFCSSAQPYAAIADFIAGSFEVDAEEAGSFLNELIDGQILLSNLEPRVSGPDFLEQIIESLENVLLTDSANQDAENYFRAFTQVKNILASAENTINKKEQISEILHQLEIQFNSESMFQVDLYKDGTAQTLSNSYADKLMESIQFLSQVTPKHNNKDLQAFKNRFTDRYDEQEIPLLQALDPESGIGYAANTNLAGEAPLVHRMVFSSGTASEIRETQYTDLSKWLIGYLTSNPSGAEINIDQHDLGNLNINPSELPPSFSIIFRLDGGNEDQIYLEHCGWPTGACMIGRFGYGDRKFENMLQDINSAENAYYQDAIVAEVAHLPEDRHGNIASRPKFRDYQIPVLAGSSADESEISLSDLMVSVRNGQLFLRSKRLNKLIIPRLSNAHNYSMNALPIYHFLGDLQGIDHKYWLGLNLEVLPKMGVFKIPRIKYKGVILSLASWYLQASDIKEILEINAPDHEKKLQKFFDHWNLPETFMYADEDNELLVHKENRIEILAWLSACKKRSQIILKEYLPVSNSILKDGDSKAVNNQFVALLTRKDNKKRPTTVFSPIRKNDNKIKRQYFPGEEWLYAKIYSGVKTADQLIGNELLELGKKLISTGLIDQWFFIRYADPEPHLRFRVHVTAIEGLGTVMREINKAFEALSETGLVWKIQFDTYEREIERYSAAGIGLSEQLFYHDSLAVASFLSRRDMVENFEQLRWLWGIRSIDSLLNDFEFSLPEKLKVMEVLSASFHQEFNSDALLIKQLSQKYRFSKELIAKHLDVGNDFSGSDLLQYRSFEIIPLAQAIKQKIEAGQIDENLNNFLISYIHMNMNRLFKTKQRVHELVVYDFLLMYYKSTFHRQKK
ncbi:MULTISPECIES: lantibiotic dehydratase [unclassified Pedobacter]|uniref:lantibiotic dehydratase n=1 Tax=unclassified Pedobacter TaxID=2628915 RepID=UPI00142380FF|nr:MULTISPECIES: lantibiotic dehydratase [unclassified Pedobacter]NII84239.1 thiopeptide-type bacteriocin biosynthesis protein [Pedobacter sp. SG908]NMN38846.1 thiopeptide-type bacteriocin biosynthesis protein [Pedobacter sp. SG918]